MNFRVVDINMLPIGKNEDSEKEYVILCVLQFVLINMEDVQ